LVFAAAGCASPNATPQATSAVVQEPTALLPVTSATETPAAQPTPGAEETLPVDTQTSPASEGGLSTYVLVPENSEARYRVTEQLANVSLPNDAIGRTKQVSGSVTINPDGTLDTANSNFTVDLSTLQSDEGMRDNFVRRNVLQTDQFPTAAFVPTGISGLTLPLPDAGQVSFQLTGDLTIRDVTKPVTWDVTGAIQGDEAVGTAVTSFTFADFNLTQPRVPVVLSIEDDITLEVDLTLRRSGE